VTLADAGLGEGIKITHVILTHAHFDHVGGIGALLGPDTTVIAQAGFPAEQARQRGSRVPFRYFTGETGAGGPAVTPDLLIAEPTALTVGGTELMLYPTTGGETTDALMVYLPASGLLFTGDVMMPYLGAPFFAEGSAEGLLEALRFIRDLRPRGLIQGHPPLTDLFTVDTFEGLQIALGSLREHVLDGIGRGQTLPRDPGRGPSSRAAAGAPAGGRAVSGDARQLRGAALPPAHRVLGGGRARPRARPRGRAARPARRGGEEPFVRAAGVLTGQGDHALALEIIEPGLLRYPASAALARLRRDALRALAERHQQGDPFRFIEERALGRRLPPGLRGRTARVVLQVGGVAGGRRRADDSGPRGLGRGCPRARGRPGRQPLRRDRGLHRVQRRVVPVDRGREPALPAAGEDLPGRLRARPGDPACLGASSAAWTACATRSSARHRPVTAPSSGRHRPRDDAERSRPRRHSVSQASAGADDAQRRQASGQQLADLGASLLHLFSRTLARLRSGEISRSASRHAKSIRPRNFGIA
jgi:glyoxylase-like metal-dependent hydrolase (beta-lactamase superfamily II)